MTLATSLPGVWSGRRRLRRDIRQDWAELQHGLPLNPEDGLFSIFSVACIGCCSLAPVMMVNDETYGKLDGKKVRKAIKKIRREAQQEAATS